MKLILALAVTISTCTAKSRHPDDFYFPVETILNGKTYLYVNRNDTAEKAYWELRSRLVDGDTLLESKIFNKDRQLNESMTEIITKGDARIQSYTVFRYDGPQQLFVKCVVQDSLVYKKVHRMKEAIQWKVLLLDPLTDKFLHLQKVRTLQSQSDNERIYKDQMSYTDINGNVLYNYVIESVYRKGIGLVSYKMMFPDGRIKDFQLSQ